ncbi:MAG: DUF2135 domain-containing protein [Deferribacteraceae bacterium]|jgi:uncharacterized protein YfaP (DUF2135 family)|nr:DUF2135 domain-containing protein [Deferribacteraceae bacterium]
MNNRKYAARLGLKTILIIALIACMNFTYADTINFSAPLNGWRNSAGDNVRYTQDIHYPAVVVNTPEDQSVNAMIAGRIKFTPKAKPQAEGSGSVGVLVVNGIPLPQRIEADGAFSRPFAFGAGSNNVELRTASGDRKRVQFYDAYTGRLQARLRIVLAWDTDATDLDLHIISPDGFHTYYGERVAPNGGALDLDVTTGYGPEIYSNVAPLPGTYLIYVNYYGGGNSDSLITVAQLTIITDEGTLNEKKETVVVPMRQAGEIVLVKQLVISRNIPE